MGWLHDPANVQQTSSKCIQNTRANAGRLLDRVNTLLSSSGISATDDVECLIAIVSCSPGDYLKTKSTHFQQRSLLRIAPITLDCIWKQHLWPVAYRIFTVTSIFAARRYMQCAIQARPICDGNFHQSGRHANGSGLAYSGNMVGRINEVTRSF